MGNEKFDTITIEELRELGMSGLVINMAANFATDHDALIVVKGTEQLGTSFTVPFFAHDDYSHARKLWGSDCVIKKLVLTPVMDYQLFDEVDFEFCIKHLKKYDSFKFNSKDYLPNDQVIELEMFVDNDVIKIRLTHNDDHTIEFDYNGQDIVKTINDYSEAFFQSEA